MQNDYIVARMWTGWKRFMCRFPEMAREFFQSNHTVFEAVILPSPFFIWDKASREWNYHLLLSNAEFKEEGSRIFPLPPHGFMACTGTTLSSTVESITNKPVNVGTFFH
jgi:hypothetical protein